jgi:hypothetical protein
MARPPFRSNTEQREWAMVLAFAGMSRRDIATALRLDVKTLAKHFGRELQEGPLIIRQQLLAALETAAAQGTKSARRLLAKAKTGTLPDPAGSWLGKIPFFLYRGSQKAR